MRIQRAFNFDGVVDPWIIADGRRVAVGTDCIEVLQHRAREEYFVSRNG